MKLRLCPLTMGRLMFFLFSFFNVLFPQVRSSLRFRSDSNDEAETSKSLLLVVPLLQSFPSFCFISENQHILNILIGYFHGENKVFTLFKSEVELVYSCDSVIMLDTTPQLSEKVSYRRFKGAFYSLHTNNTSSVNLTKFSNCFENSSSPEVVVMSLQDGSFFELSPIFPFPRSFFKSSVQEVIGHRSRSNFDDFKGVNLTGAFMNYPPFTIVRSEEIKRANGSSLNTTSDEIDGIEVMVFRELSKKLNFNLHHIIHQRWGTTSPNGTWLDGVGYAMQQGLAHLAVCGLWQIYSLSSFIDFGPSVAVGETIFLVRRPEQIDFDWKDVMKIFKVFVWIFVFTSFVVTSVVYWYGVVRILPLFREDWSYSFLTVFGHFTMSTSHSYVNDQFTLTVLTAWSIFSLLLTTVLSTGIVSSLILPMYSSRVDTLKQLVEGGYYWTAQYYIEFVSEDLKASIFDFQNKRHKLYEKRYKYMTENAVSAAMYTDKKMTMISQVLNNDFVVLDTDGTVGHEALKLYRVARESLGRGHISFGVEKHSPMLEPLTIMTMRFMEAGLLRKWKFQVLYRWPLFNTRHLLMENDVPTFGQPEVMPISKLRPLFYMLTAGLMFAFIIFCLEILWYNG